MIFSRRVEPPALILASRRSRRRRAWWAAGEEEGDAGEGSDCGVVIVWLGGVGLWEGVRGCELFFGVWGR